MAEAAPAPAEADRARQLSKPEFVALMAMLAAMVAFSIDAMLPALPEIAADLTPDAPNRAQLILTSFVLGMGLGTFFTGPLSDRFGRKPVMIGGAALYIFGAILAWSAPSLELMLAARALQGLGAAGPRVVAMAMVRDLYSGRSMAQTMSFVMIVFTLVPALAPTMGAGIMAIAGWRGIFVAFLVFATVASLWLTLRQPETLPRHARLPLRPARLIAAVAEMFAHPTTRLSIFVQMLGFGMLFGMLSSTQQIFDVSYGRGEHFHFWFGGIAVVAASASVLNARLVGRLGMRPLIKAMLTAQLGLSGCMVLFASLGLAPETEFWIFLVWTTSVFFQNGLTIGNLNALAMEPMGHIAGLAASIISAVATVGAVVIAVPIGLAFNGTPLPLAVSIFALAAVALFLTSRIRRESDAD